MSIENLLHTETTDRMDIYKKAFLQYEIANAPFWVGLLGWTKWADLVAKFYANRVERKYKKYVDFLYNK